MVKDSLWLYTYVRRDQKDLITPALVWAESRGIRVERQTSESGGVTLRILLEDADKLLQNEGSCLLPFSWSREKPIDAWPFWSRKPTFANNKKEWEKSGIVIGAAVVLRTYR